MTALPSEPAARLKGWHVLLIFVAFFGVVIAVNVGFVVMSIRTFPGQVSVTPYEDGLLHDRAVAQFEAQEQLGWSATAAPEADAVVVEFHDRAGAPLSGLHVSGDLQRPATEAGRITLRFRETRPGRFVARHSGLAGAWDLTAVAVESKAHRFEAQRRLVWP
jgi:nitrogen fixation protein FixH